MDTCNNIDTSERSQTIECILCKSVSIKLQKCKLIDTDRKHTTLVFACWWGWVRDYKLRRKLLE